MQLPKNITDDGAVISVELFGTTMQIFSFLTMIAFIIFTIWAVGVVLVDKLYSLTLGLVAVIPIPFGFYALVGNLTNVKIVTKSGRVIGKRLFSVSWKTIGALTNPEDQLLISNSKIKSKGGSIDLIDLVLKVEDGGEYKIWSSGSSEGVYSAEGVRDYITSRLGS